jgi:aerobic carbon-monoxide dehydrogenase medium subunit
MLRRFELDQPDSVSEASALLGKHGDDARLYAGGTELLLVMKEGLLRPGHLIDLKSIPGFGDISLDDSGEELRIGAGATHRMVERSSEVRQHLPALVQLEHNVANVRVRNTGTIGGNLCFAEPHADPGTLLLVYEATARLERDTAVRSLPLAEFFVGPFEVALEPDEVLTRLDVPLPPPRTKAAYLKFGMLERPSVGVAAGVTLTPDGSGIEDVRFAIGCVGPRPLRAHEAEAKLKGLSLAEATAKLDDAGDLAAEAAQAVSDLHGSAGYKRHLVKVLLRRAFTLASTDDSGVR